MTVNAKIDEILAGGFISELEDVKLSPKKQRQVDSERRRISLLYGSSISDALIQKRTAGGKSDRKKNPESSLPPSHPDIIIEPPSSRLSRLDPLSSPDTRHLSERPTHSSRVKTRSKSPQESHESGSKSWYFGYQNRTFSAPANQLSMVRRYGAQGTVKILAVEKQVTPPEKKTKKDERAQLENAQCSTTAFLSPPVTENAYVPPLRATPSLWPESSAYVTGTTLHFRTTRSMAKHSHSNVHSNHPRATTYENSHCRGQLTNNVNHPNPNPNPNPRLADSHLQKLAKHEREQSQALEAALTLEHHEKREKMKHALARVKIERARRKTSREYVDPASFCKAHVRVLVDASLLEQNHSGSLWSNQHNVLPFGENVKNRNNLTQDLTLDMSQRKYVLKWTALQSLDVILRQRARDRSSVHEILHRILALALDWSLACNTGPYVLTREAFSQMWAREFPTASPRDVQCLYSSFDFRRTDRLDIRLLILTLRVLKGYRSPDLMEIFSWFQESLVTTTTDESDSDLDSEAGPSLTLMHIREIVTCCVASPTQEAEILAFLAPLSRSDSRLSPHRIPISRPSFQTLVNTTPALSRTFEEQVQARKMEL